MCFQLFSETRNAFYDSNGLRKEQLTISLSVQFVGIEINSEVRGLYSKLKIFILKILYL